MVGRKVGRWEGGKVHGCWQRAEGTRGLHAGEGMRARTSPSGGTGRPDGWRQPPAGVGAVGPASAVRASRWRAPPLRDRPSVDRRQLASTPLYTLYARARA
jgi:hypothetical protein